MRIEIKGVIIPNDYKWMYDFLEMESTCPKDILQKLEDAKGQEVDVYINSPGGSLHDGVEIYAALKEYGKVHIHVVGLAASMASVIMCAGDCDISAGSMVMLHNVAGGARGDYHVMNKSSEILQQANKAIAEAYTQKTGKTIAELLAVMDYETWYTAEEAIEAGLADRMAGERPQLMAAAYGVPLLLPEVAQKLTMLLKIPQAQADADFLYSTKLQHELLTLRRTED